MKQTIIFFFVLQFFLFQITPALATDQNNINQKNPLFTTVYSYITELKGRQKFPIFTKLSEYTKPSTFSLKKVNTSLFITFRTSSSFFSEKILPVYGFSSYVLAGSERR